jgi:hypothetical protein
LKGGLSCECRAIVRDGTTTKKANAKLPYRDNSRVRFSFHVDIEVGSFPIRRRGRAFEIVATIPVEPPPLDRA